MQEVTVALNDASRLADRDVELSKEEENCEYLDCGAMNALKLDAQRLPAGSTYILSCMNFLIWNVKGLNHPSKQNEVKKYDKAL